MCFHRFFLWTNDPASYVYLYCVIFTVLSLSPTPHFFLLLNINLNERRASIEIWLQPFICSPIFWYNWLIDWTVVCLNCSITPYPIPTRLLFSWFYFFFPLSSTLFFYWMKVSYYPVFYETLFRCFLFSPPYLLASLLYQLYIIPYQKSFSSVFFSLSLFFAPLPRLVFYWISTLCCIYRVCIYICFSYFPLLLFHHFPFHPISEKKRL